MRSEERDLAPPQQEHYPPFLGNAEERRRFDLCVAIAREVLSVDGEPVPEAELWAMSRSLFRSEHPTW